MKEMLASFFPLFGIEFGKKMVNEINNLIVGEDFALAIKTARLSSFLEDVKFLFNLPNMLVMDRSIGLYYQV